MHVVRWCGLAPAAHCQQYFYASPYFILHLHPENNLTFLFSSCYKWLEGFLHFNKWVLTECFCVHCTKLEAVAIGRVYFFFFNSSIVDLQCCVSFRCIAKYTHTYIYTFSSVQFSGSVMSNFLQPPWTAALQSSLSIIYSQNLLKLTSVGCHPTISSSVVPFSSCLQSFATSGSFPRSEFFASGDQSICVSASASVLSMNIHDWLPLGWTGLISLQSKGLSWVFSTTTV